MLQGIWIDDGDQTAIFMAKGDTISYPDSSSLPVKFWIYQDSLYMQGSHLSHYKITKQAPHVFNFVNEMGDEIKLVKTDDNSLRGQFNGYKPYALNIFRTTDTDTIVYADGERYGCRIHVEPTSDRVTKSDYNDIGIEVDNLYLDNLARVIVLYDGVVIYSHEFHKAEFERYVPKDVMVKSILRNVEFDHADKSNVYMNATIGIPDATSAYVVELKVQRNGSLFMKLK